MRVALLIEKFAAKGGAERMAAYVVDGLRSRGHEVHVYASAFRGDGYERHPVAKGSHAQFAARCKAALDGAAFDVVHSFTRTLRHDILRLGGGLHAEYLKRVAPARNPIDRVWAKINPKERKILAIEKDGLAAAKLVQAVSQRVKREAIDHYGVDPRKIAVTHNAVDLARFHPDLRRHRDEVLRELGIPRDATVALFVGSGARRKGLAHAIDGRGDAHLVVVGDAKPRQLARVHFAGVRADVERFYGAADVFVFPTLYDPFPNACLEALACGVPVVVTRVAGVSEIMTDGREGFVVDDARDVADRVRRIATPMRAAARALAETRPISRYVDETLALYARLTGR